jgi:hypothetical protein|tara:strand:+ start:135 stop:344 length:210 start_codon:yes stop_codon:yes gene_type:complete
MARIKLKRSEIPTAVPNDNDLLVGEVAINTEDRKMYVKDSGNNIIEIANKGVSDADATAKAVTMAIALG